MQYERLFQPLTIRGMTLKNRIVMPAMHLMYNMDGCANERFDDFYYRRAEGGAALIFVGGCRFDEFGGSPGMMSLETDDFVPGYREFTDGMHQRGALVGVQLYHAGAYAHSIGNDGRQAIAPSDIHSRFTKEDAREATVAELHTVIEKCAAAAKRAKDAGFDVVELSASAGYLVCQFLSEKTNRRTDEYGGSRVNRTRFPRELLRAVRAAVGPDYPICVRIAGSDFVPGSCTNEDAVAFARLLEENGADMINVTGGWHETVVPQLTGDVPRAGFVYLAAAVKDAVAIPVAASNRINDPAEAEKVLALEQADMVSLGRALLADPDFPKKAAADDAGLIRRCIACTQGCLARTFFAQPAGCIINGYAGHECEHLMHRTREPKNILVLGAGVAGCEFSIQAALRGNNVTIWEKSRMLGGQLRLAAAPHAKHEFASLIDYYRNMLARLSIPVEYGHNAGPEEILESCFDAVVIATGAKPKKLVLPASCRLPVVSAADVLSGSVIAGRNVVVIGGGSVGCETADFLAYDSALSPEQAAFLLTQRAETPEHVLTLLDGARRRVSIVDTAKIGTGFEPGTAWPLLKELDRLAVGQYPLAEMTAFTDNSLTVEYAVPKTKEQKIREHETGEIAPEKRETVTLPCDTIVSAIGSVPDDALFEALRDDCPALYRLGDAQRVGRIADAVEQAISLAESL